jgi:hypothetical protein
MDERDQELLEQQMRGCQPPSPSNAALTLAGTALFVSGLIFGSLVFTPVERTEHAVSYSSQPLTNKFN